MLDAVVFPNRRLCSAHPRAWSALTYPATHWMTMRARFLLAEPDWIRRVHRRRRPSHRQLAGDCCPAQEQCRLPRCRAGAWSR